MTSEVCEALKAAYLEGFSDGPTGGNADYGFKWWIDSHEGKMHLDAIDRAYAEMYY